MKRKVKLADILLVVVGLLGAVLLWLHLDPKGSLLYLSFLLFGAFRASDFFGLKHFERTLTEILKLITSVLMIVISGSHLIVGDKPFFGMLSLIVLLLAFSTLEPQKDISESEI